MDFIKKAIESGKNILVVGTRTNEKTSDTETSKTCLPMREVSIEDAAEFRLSDIEFSAIRSFNK